MGSLCPPQEDHEPGKALKESIAHHKLKITQNFSCFIMEICYHGFYPGIVSVSFLVNITKKNLGNEKIISLICLMLLFIIAKMPVICFDL
jgi:hypothetical protein